MQARAEDFKIGVMLTYFAHEVSETFLRHT